MAQILPSLLSADFANLQRQVEEVAAVGAQMLHFDVMDGRFVPNISVGVPVLKSIRRITRMIIDVHLMIVEPEKYIETFVEAGADWVSFHHEATAHANRVVQQIHQAQARAGIVINPATPVSVLEQILPAVDYALIMSVNPGFGGQTFIADSLDKLQKLKQLKLATGARALTEIDGGIGPENIELVVKYGADLIVVGSSIFSQKHPAQALQKLQALAAGAEQLNKAER
ncbi:MAG: ribulose-phosphate 3-epimerase [Acidobacteria bacterium]|nr:ribulose-phosphate 3-epimerase [Acidobacteriota bacterium]